MQNISLPTERENQTEPAQDFFTYDEYVIFMTSFAVTWTVLPFLGVISNVINIRTFILMGLEDGITLSFLALSFSDLGFVLVLLIQGLSMIFSVIELHSDYNIWFAVDTYAIVIFCGNICDILYIMTELTTTYLSVARCMCVAMPLQFKNIFTRKVTIIFQASFVVFAVVGYVPILGYMGIVTQFDARINASRPQLWISPERESIADGLRGLSEMFLPFASHFITIVCVIIMNISLRKSVKFRHRLSNELSGRVTSDIDSSEKALPMGRTDTGGQVSSKEAQVVRQVILICVVYIVCNFPKILLTIANLLAPDFALGQRFHYTYLIFQCFRYNIDAVNSSINVFIYYRFNSKFRKHCRLLA